MTKWLVCGTQIKGKSYKTQVQRILSDAYWNANGCKPKGTEWKPEIVEGCCPESADQYAEEWAKNQGFTVKHFPATDGTYLKRNIEMVNELKEGDRVFAFWDGYSYGTAHTIAHAAAKGIPITIKKIVIDSK